MLTPPDIAPQSWRREDGYELTTDRRRLDLDVIHGFLSGEAYWSTGMSRALLERALAASLPMAVLAPDGSTAGFARLVTDYTVFAYLRDVFTLPQHRGKGLAGWRRPSAATPNLPAFRLGCWPRATRMASMPVRATGRCRIPNGT